MLDEVKIEFFSGIYNSCESFNRLLYLLKQGTIQNKIENDPQQSKKEHTNPKQPNR